jgi:glycosyltransferase involved in cell wall biosynthesis
MLKVLGLALYGTLAASTRYRLTQYTPGLSALGIDLQVTSLLGNEYLARRFHGGAPPLPSMLRDGMARLRQLAGSGEFDAAMVYCELFPLMPAWVERALLKLPYVYDLDDAFYLRYRLGRKRLLEPVLGHKFDGIIEGAAAVTAGNRTLADYARRFNGSVTELPTVVDVTRYTPTKDRKRATFTVGWIGSPSTSTYLPDVAATLSALGAEAPLDFVVVGGKAPHIPNVNVVEIEWDEATEVDLINTFDVGIMPLPDDEWARGKCAFKLIQYMACGVPVLASPVGANVQVVTPECGFLAGTQGEWEQCLRTLRDDPAMRSAMGDASRERVVEHYSLQRAVPLLAEVLHRTAARR